MSKDPQRCFPSAYWLSRGNGMSRYQGDHIQWFSNEAETHHAYFVNMVRRYTVHSDQVQAREAYNALLNEEAPNV